MEIHRFRLGSLDCISVRDGVTRVIPPNELFVKASPELLDKALRQHGVPPEGALNSVACLVVHTGTHQVLVDTGGGPGSLPKLGWLHQNLLLAGMDAQKIDTVILTHRHWDHIGGNAIEDGMAAFPNATYVMTKREWDFITSAETLAAMMPAEVALIHKNLVSIRDHIKLLDHEGEIRPGVEAIFTPGHTIGHMAVAFRSGGEELLCLGDAAIHPIHVSHPTWRPDFDLDARQATDSTRQLLQRAAAHNALIFAPHFPFPGVGRIVKRGEAWQWRPIQAKVEE